MEDKNTIKVELKKLASAQSSIETQEAIQKNLTEIRKTATTSHIDWQNVQFNQQMMSFREFLKSRSFRMLYAEMAFLALLIVLQGFGHRREWFYLNDWVIGAFSGGCLFQTFLIIRYIAVNIFPNNSTRSKGDTHVHHHHHK